MPEMSRTWHKSSYSSARGEDCVEVREDQGGADVRDTQNRDAGHLSFAASEWSAFLHAARTGEL